MHFARPGLVIGLLSAALVIGAAPPAHAQQDDSAKAAAKAASRAAEENAPRYNTQCNDKAKAGTFVCKYPGNGYGVKAYTKKKKPSRDDILALDRQVFMRTAQLAIENDRSHFTMTGEKTSDTYQKGETKYVRGTAGYTTSQQCGVTAGGVRYCYPGQTVAGTPGYSYEKRGVIGRDALVKLWTTQEKDLIDAGRLYRVVESTLYDAEQTYSHYRDSTPGRWPTLIDLYETRAKRFERIAAAGGAGAQGANMTVMRTYLRLAAAYGAAGREADAAAAAQRALSFTSVR